MASLVTEREADRLDCTSDDHAQALRAELADRVIPVRPLLIRICNGNINAALVLQHAGYLTSRFGDGWFYHSRRQWEEETTLTRWQLESCRNALRILGFLRERRRGILSHLEFTVDIDCLKRICRAIALQKVPIQQQDGQRLLALELRSVRDFHDFLMREPTVTFRASFSRITGSITAAVMLSQLLYLQKAYDSWDWFVTQAGWEDQLCIKRKRQENARRKLCQLGFVKEELRGLPRRLYFAVDVEAVQAALLCDAEQQRASHA